MTKREKLSKSKSPKIQHRDAGGSELELEPDGKMLLMSIRNSDEDHWECVHLTPEQLSVMAEMAKGWIK